MIGNIVKYSDFYRENPPKDYINLIKNIPKEELLVTVNAINSRLKPIMSLDFDDSREVQINCLNTILLNNKQNLDVLRCSKNLINRFLDFPIMFSLFTRVTCLYAIQEILNYEGFNEGKIDYTFEIRENIFKFLLIINENILKYDEKYNVKELEKEYNSFEFFMFKELPHNQYYNTINPIHLIDKSNFLFEKINSDVLYGEHLRKYLKDSYLCDEIGDLFHDVFSIYISSNDEVLGLTYINIEPEKHPEVVKFLDKLSERITFDKLSYNDPKIFEFLSIKKSPIYKCKSKNENIVTYLILDSILFLEKLYSLFINDFWFDYLKPNKVCTRKDWGNFIGAYFYEPFLEMIFKNMFKYNKKTIFKHTDDLKIKLSKNEIEYADFYIRNKNRVILAEAKSNYLPVINGYKTVSNIEDFKKIDLNKFYKDYGLKQLVEKTLKYFHDYKFLLNDDKQVLSKKIKLYPLLIVNDPIISSNYAINAFRNKFKELLKDNNIEINSEEHLIYPLAIINTSDLQKIEQSLKNRDENIFNLLRHYHSITNNSIKKNQDILMTFSNTSDRIIKNKLISKRIKLKNIFSI
ncbi:hypothetical protein [Aureivirga sp. CE67]|uniref:hypothetical protein n=1 Tax=Aureivirga sp. CE67 TaxID=1788983 RepID=UPI0018C9016A|nr:hypothetical protein [Aureivirga sp. CE67]